jgi:hypothetical protein
MLFFYKLVRQNKKLKKKKQKQRMKKFLRAMFTKYNAQRYLLIIILKLWVVFVFCNYYAGNESKMYLSITQCKIILTVDLEPFILALTIYILVHTSLVSARDILVTFGGKKLVIKRDPNRAVLKKKIRSPVAPVVLGMTPRPGIIPPNVSNAPCSLMPAPKQNVGVNSNDLTGTQ